jgi:hypothetical protein
MHWRTSRQWHPEERVLKPALSQRSEGDGGDPGPRAVEPPLQRTWAALTALAPDLSWYRYAMIQLIRIHMDASE